MIEAFTNSRNLKNLAQGCTDLFLWLDCDREGEAIAYEVIQICVEANPNLQIHRAKFSAITRRDLEDAFNNPTRPDHRQNEAVLARQEIDLRTGAAFTRLQTLWVRQSFPRAILEKVLSYGSCQFPTLSFIVERYLQHVKFQNTKFWYINVCFKHQKYLSFKYNKKQQVRLQLEPTEIVRQVHLLHPLQTHDEKRGNRPHHRGHAIRKTKVQALPAHHHHLPKTRGQEAPHVK